MCVSMVVWTSLVFSSLCGFTVWAPWFLWFFCEPSIASLPRNKEERGAAGSGERKKEEKEVLCNTVNVQYLLYLPYLYYCILVAWGTYLR